MNENGNYTLVIKPKSGWISLNLRELWHFRELFYIFAWRDIKVRYKQTVIGITWAVMQPFFSMVVFSIFFGHLAKIPSNGIPYPVFVYSGLLFWNYFSTSLSGASNSLIANESIIKKIYFPRLLLPASATITPIIDFGFALVVYFGLLVFYHVAPSPLGLILLPVLILLSFLTATGLGSLLAAINIRFRDVREALPFFIQLLFFVTPVIYPTSIVPVKFQWLLGLNPMSGIIETARAILVHDKAIHFSLLIFSSAAAVILFLWGVFYFKKSERIFADIA